MGFKKKLSLGALSATLGLTLVAGGTWAAFNDIEEVSAGVEAGTLELDLAEYDGPMEFIITDLKPGDTMTRYIDLQNVGSLAIKDVLLSAHVGEEDFTDYLEGNDPDTYGSNTADEFMEQFKITLLRKGIEGNEEEIISEGEGVTLADLVNNTQSFKSAAGDHYVSDQERVNVASIANNQWTGLPADPRDNDVVELSIKFKEVANDPFVLNSQNDYQGDKLNVKFILEARQWDGQEITDSDTTGEGLIGDVETNRKANNGE